MPDRANASRHEPSRKFHYAAALAVVLPAIILISPFLLFAKFNNYELIKVEIVTVSAFIVIIGAFIGIILNSSSSLTRTLTLSLAIALFLDFQFGFQTIIKESFSDAEVRWISWGMLGSIAFAGMYLGCCLICWILRRHAVVVAAVVFSSILIGVIALPVGSVATGVRSARTASDAPDSALPPILHLILDEHGGLDSFPMASEGAPISAEYLHAFFREFGFRIYPSAYSLYQGTVDSISKLLNYSTSELAGEFILKKDRNYIVSDNKYLESLAKKGYRIFVYQSDFLQVCDSDVVEFSSCYQYPSNSIGTISNSNLNIFDKIRLIASQYLELSFLYQTVRTLYNKKIYSEWSDRIPIPPWNWERNRLGPLPVSPVIRRLTDDVIANPTGSAFFAHLLTPHYPYIYNGECSIKNVGNWEGLRDRYVVEPRSDEQSARAGDYSAYFEQVKCLYRQLQTLFMRMKDRDLLDNATIILHGDHGSRILGLETEKPGGEKLANDVLVDRFGTLLAIKSPTIEPGIDRTRSAIHYVLPAFWTGEAVEPHEAFVYSGQTALQSGNSLVRRELLPAGELLED